MSSSQRWSPDLRGPCACAWKIFFTPFQPPLNPSRLFKLCRFDLCAFRDDGANPQRSGARKRLASFVLWTTFLLLPITDRPSLGQKQFMILRGGGVGGRREGKEREGERQRGGGCPLRVVTFFCVNRQKLAAKLGSWKDGP